MADDYGRAVMRSAAPSFNSRCPLTETLYCLSDVRRWTMKLSAIARRTEGISFLGAGSGSGLADPEAPLPQLRRPRPRSPETLPLELAMSNAPIPRKSL